MTRNETIAVATVAVVAVAATTVEYLAIRRTERAKRAAIDLNTEKSVKAIFIAGGRIGERIRAGKYDASGVTGIQQDFAFEQIVAFNEL